MTPRLEAIRGYWHRQRRAAERGRHVDAERELCRTDLFYLLCVVLGRGDINNDWLFERCREVQASPNGYLDLWAREHYKSTLITFALTIQDILRDPEITVGIFSFTRPNAKQFLRQIKRELEANERLRALFPDILWESPQREAPKWSEDDGLIVRRRGNPKESTVEAWGLVDGQPTSKHFRLMVYDDVVTRESVTTPEMIEKVTTAWAESRALRTDGGVARYIGTRWHQNDTYRTILDRKAAVERRHTATDDGTEAGEPVLKSKEWLYEQRRDMGPYIFCLPGEAPVLMANGQEKRIDLIEPGDKVVGYTIGEAPDRGRYVEAEVLRVSVIDNAPVYVYMTEDGDRVFCTGDHKWFAGRIEEGRQLYAPLSLDTYHGLKRLQRMYRRRECPDMGAAAWLGGLFDGEGSISGNALHISQSPDRNPQVCTEIERVFSLLGMAYSKFDLPAGERHGRNCTAGRDYYLTDGRQGFLDFVRWCRPVKSPRIMDRVLVGRRSDAVKVTSRGFVGHMPVYGIETTTGNYIAYGFLSKNSAQMLLDPTADRAQGFRVEWLRYWSTLDHHDIGADMNRYLLVDAASAKKKHSDYTAMGVIGLGSDGNYYVLDLVRDRLNLTERMAALFALHRRWKPKAVGYEKYGMMADVEYAHIRMRDENYRFEITEVGGTMPKPDRIKRLVPIFEEGRFWLPDTLRKIDYEGNNIDLVQSFVTHEYLAFPVSAHDDMLDMFSRIFDVSTTWPREVERHEDRYARPRYARPRSRSAWAA
jgi:phage terminase large subunit-like protein